MRHSVKLWTLILFLSVLIVSPAQLTRADPLDIVDPLEPYNSVRLYRDVQAIADRYPEIVTLDTIGRSVLGKDIPLLKLGVGRRPLLWIGALHGREVVTTGYLLLLAETYAQAYTHYEACGDTPAEKVQWLLDEFVIYIVPMANPDGVDIVTAGGTAEVYVQNPKTWKSNANGVNLNRNFPFDWDSYKPKMDHPKNNYLNFTGVGAGSEPETQALMALCESVAFEHMVSCHCQGKVLYWRDNKNGPIPGDEALARAIAKTTGYRMLPSTTSAAAGWAGGFENWFRYRYNRPGVCMEFCRYNTVDFETMAKFYTSDMVNWPKSQNLLFDVMNQLSRLAAAPTASDVYIDGERILFDAYLIGGANYFKLRDVAYALAGTDKQFEVEWDGDNNAILLSSGQFYTPVGGEMAPKGESSKTPLPTQSAIILDGQKIRIKACNIDGNNYFRLRDIGKLFDFNVSWAEEENAVLIETGEGYTED